MHTFLPEKQESEELVQYSIQYEFQRLAENPSETHFLGCTSHKTGEIAESFLTRISNHEVQPIYTSTSKDTVCYLFYADSKKIEAIPAFVKIAPISNGLKFSPGLFEHSQYELLERRLHGHPITKKIPNGDFSLSEHLLHDKAGLVVYSHVASTKDIHKEIFQDAINKLANEGHLKNLKESFFWATEGSHSNSLISKSWTKHFEKMNEIFTNGEKCDLSSVQLSSVRNNHFIIDGIRSMHSSQEHYSTCVMNLLAHLSMDHRVTYIIFRPKFEAKNGVAQWITQSGISDYTPVYSNGITGLGEIIGVSDTGLDERSCYFYDYDQGGVVARSEYTSPTYDLSRRKVVQYISFVDSYDYTSGHGTHVCGSVAGNVYDAYSGSADLISSSSSVIDTFDPTINNGIAYDAKLAFYDIGDSDGSLTTPSDLATDLFEIVYQTGARIHSNSWGTSYNGYLIDDLYIDEYTFDYDDALVLFAAGNDGDDGANTVGSPAVSKNALTVGASESGPTRFTTDIDYMAWFSSQGPVYDDRIKPDVSAPGYFVESARSNGYTTSTSCEMLTMAGTSMATPVTAGNTALIRQFFRDGFYADALDLISEYYTISCDIYPCDAFNASGALMKAMLVSSAKGLDVYPIHSTGTEVELGSPPDNYQGFGRIQLDRVVFNSSAITTLLFAYEGSLTRGEILNFTYTVINSTSDIEVTLVWMDPPNSIYAAKQVLNDLDVIVISSNGLITYANSGSSKDELNNVEKIVISNNTISSNDELIIQVSAGAIYKTQHRPQPFALVITGIGIVESQVSGTHSVTNSTMEYDCYNKFDDMLGYSFCASSGLDCATYFCDSDSCPYSYMCDLYCGYCTNDDTDTTDDNGTSNLSTSYLVKMFSLLFCIVFAIFY